MNPRLLLTTAIFTLSASVVAAQGVAEQVVSQLQAQGFTRIEVKQGPTQVKVEAIRGNTEVEYIYDLSTGQLLSREVGRVDAGDDTRPGIEYDRRDEDFIGDNDDDDDDSGRGRGRGGDDDDDDNDDRDDDDNDDRDDDDDDRGGRDDDDDDDDRDDDDDDN